MAFYVYIIQSEVDKRYYKGFTENPLKRLQQHNEGQNASTRPFLPWRIVYIEELDTKSKALIREKNLKKATRERIQALILHPKNLANKFRNG